MALRHRLGPIWHHHFDRWKNRSRLNALDLRMSELLVPHPTPFAFGHGMERVGRVCVCACARYVRILRQFTLIASTRQVDTVIFKFIVDVLNRPITEWKL